MRVGDVDGLGEIYDDQGELILNADEKILIKIVGVFDLSTKWKSFWSDPVMDPYEGTIYVTNSRLVGIREPSIWEAKYDMTPFGMPTAVAKIAKAKSLKKMGAKEYCAIPLKSIVKVKAVSPLLGRKEAVWVWMYILNHEKKYHLSVGCDRDIGSTLMNVLKGKNSGV